MNPKTLKARIPRGDSLAPKELLDIEEAHLRFVRQRLGRFQGLGFRV